MIQQHQSKKQIPVIRNNVIESLRDIGGSVGKSVGNDILSHMPEDALSSLFGPVVNNGELNPNQTIEFPEKKSDEIQNYRPEILHRQPLKEDERELGRKINDVRQELTVLSTAEKNPDLNIRKTVQETPVEPGIYHLNFFERLRSLVQENIEDSRTWLATWSTCKKKKNYWGMYKKHGTTFGLSNERTLATSAG